MRHAERASREDISYGDDRDRLLVWKKIDYSGPFVVSYDQPTDRVRLCQFGDPNPNRKCDKKSHFINESYHRYSLLASFFFSFRRVPVAV